MPAWRQFGLRVTLSLFILIQLQGCISMNTQRSNAENTVNSTLERAFAGELAPAQASSNRSKIDTSAIH